MQINALIAYKMVIVIVENNLIHAKEIKSIKTNNCYKYLVYWYYSWIFYYFIYLKSLYNWLIENNCIICRWLKLLFKTLWLRN